MNAQQMQALTAVGTDVAAALRRMGNDETIFHFCMETFLEDKTMQQLNDALERNAWRDAFRAAHALKGMAGNMGFIPLMLSASSLTELLRAENTAELEAPAAQVKLDYSLLMDAIQQYFACATP